MPNLTDIPTEVLEHITFLSTTDGDASPRPPSALAALLRTSRSVHTALSIRTNPHCALYSRIFADKFDLAAPKRRLPPHATQPSNLALELRRRFMSLNRVRAAAAHPSTFEKLFPGGAEIEETMWILYFMVIENDGKNMRLLKEWARLGDWITIWWNTHMVDLSRRGSWHTETNEKALGVWLLWFVMSKERMVAEPPQVRSDYQLVLRPIAFAAFRYDAFHAPYYLASPFNPIQPSSFPSSMGPLLGPGDFFVPAPNDAPEEEDLPPIDNHPWRPPSSLTHPASHARYRLPPPPRCAPATVWHFSIPITLAPPLLSHAAILHILSRAVNPSGHGAPSAANAPSNYTGPTAEDFEYLRSVGVKYYGDGRSKDWECDWWRSVGCWNPWADVCGIEGRKGRVWIPGMLDGVWEGRYMYSDLSGYLHALSGGPPTILGADLAHGGTFIGLYPHFWKIQEHYILQRYCSTHAEGHLRPPQHSVEPPSPNDAEVYPATVGHVFNGFWPEGATSEVVDNGEALEISEPAPFAPQDATKRLVSRYETYQPFDSFSPSDSESEADEDEEFDEEFEYMRDGERYDPQKHGSLVDIVLTGGGHSAWGQFGLRGRVRMWDGMIVLRKDYNMPTAERGGRWIYRGYLVGGHNIVGRWRDVSASVHVNGYEGVFSLTRRR